MPELCFRLARLYAASVLLGGQERVKGAGREGAEQRVARKGLVRILKYASRTVAGGGEEVLEMIRGRGMWEEEVLLLGTLGHAEVRVPQS